MKKKPKKKRTDDEYVELDDAIRVLSSWSDEISDELAKHNVPQRSYADVLHAMQRVHSPEE